ncbi:MAG TPA: hypothetical protein VK642_16355 [Burkholderiales bacterium]|nr:hypothetical protein [Burkholderiales bacterium]
MQIIDAIHRSTTAHEICFLLTNYVETLQFYDGAQRLPAGVAALPVQGLDDIETRFTGLREAKLCGLARSHCDTHGAIVNEATDVFYEALCRLKTLTISAGLLAASGQSAVHINALNISI